VFVKLSDAEEKEMESQRRKEPVATCYVRCVAQLRGRGEAAGG